MSDAQKLRDIQLLEKLTVYRAYVLPLFCRVPHVVKPVGSAVLVAAGPQLYLFTAAHVFDNCKGSICVQTESGFEPLTSPPTLAPMGHLDRSRDFTDYAVYKVPPSLASELLKTKRAFSLLRVAMAHDARQFARCFLIGYPSAKMKKNAEGTYVPLALIAPAPIASSMNYRLTGASPAKHIVLESIPRDSFGANPTNTAQGRPSFAGMSGGAIFAYLRDYSLPFDVDAVELVGVFNSEPRKGLLLGSTLQPYLASIGLLNFSFRLGPLIIQGV